MVDRPITRRHDAAYDLTRRDGVRIVVTRVIDTSSDPETGEKTPVTQVTNVRRAVLQPTQYSRLLRADATQQRLGKTTIIIWTRDVDFTELQTEDYITVTSDGKRYEVMTSSVEDTSFVITADEYQK